MHRSCQLQSWGRVKRTCKVYRPQTPAQCAPLFHPKQPFIAHAQGMSYGDQALNESVILTHKCNRILSFDKQKGQITAEGGIRLKELLEVVVKEGYLLPVIPGSMHVSLGGAIANDVHGKNQARVGCFGHHLIDFELLTPQQAYQVSRQQHSDLFFATLGGMGLSGIITKARLQLIKAPACVEEQCHYVDDLEACMKALKETSLVADYANAWLDLGQAKGTQGLILSANYSLDGSADAFKCRRFPVPMKLINPVSARLVNMAYLRTKRWQRKSKTCHILTHNNPLDKIENYNYLYGRKGFLQLHALVCENNAIPYIQMILALCARHNTKPILSVAKYFNQKGLGLMSFCHPGYSFAIDFFNTPQARALIDKAHRWLSQNQGRVYLAKDLLLSKEQFKTMYPQHKRHKQLLKAYGLDAYFKSSMSQRLGYDDD